MATRISQTLFGNIREHLVARRRRSHPEKQRRKDGANVSNEERLRVKEKRSFGKKSQVTTPMESYQDMSMDVSQDDQERLQAAIRSLFKQSNPHSKSRAATTRLQNIHQREEWDCGVACLQIILRWLRGADTDSSGDLTLSTGNAFALTAAEEEERDFMLKFLGTQSIWTVELILLLENILSKMEENENRRLASYLMCSKKLEVDSEHSRLGYYERAFSDDSVRVQSRFEDARQANLPMLSVCELSWDTILELISREDCVAIILLDGSILRDEHLKAYSGHYVVLSGVTYDSAYVRKASSDSDYCIVIKNPSSHNETDYVSPSKLERAWRAHGTDDDIVLIAKHYKQHQVVG